MYTLPGDLVKVQTLSQHVWDAAWHSEFLVMLFQVEMCFVEAREIAQAAECLSQKHEDPNSVPKTLVKNVGCVTSTSNPRAEPHGGRDKKIAGVLG